MLCLVRPSGASPVGWARGYCAHAKGPQCSVLTGAVERARGHDVAVPTLRQLSLAYPISPSHNGNVSTDINVPAEIKNATNGPLPPMRAAST